MQQSDKQLALALALQNARGIGPHKFKAIIHTYPLLADFFALPGAELKALKLKEETIHDIKNPDWTLIEQALRWAEKDKQTILVLGDLHYPELLSTIADPPAVLFLRGSPHLLKKTQLAIVGSRNPTYYGQEIAYTFARALAKHGLVITSGLALGIDGYGHEGALAAPGETIAVMGAGLAHIYPRSHQALAERIAEAGLLVSELAPHMPPKAEHFPRRNRIISALSIGVIVIEAALKSGSLITARLAMEQGREVFAIPGSIHNALSKGCHALIRQGAKLVDSLQDIVDELPLITLPLPTNTKKLSLGRAPKALLESLAYEVTPIDTIVRRLNWSVEKVTEGLLELEMQNLVKSVPGGYVRVSYTHDRQQV